MKKFILNIWEKIGGMKQSTRLLIAVLSAFGTAVPWFLADTDWGQSTNTIFTLLIVSIIVLSLICLLFLTSLFKQR